MPVSSASAPVAWPGRPFCFSPAGISVSPRRRCGASLGAARRRPSCSRSRRPPRRSARAARSGPRLGFAARAHMPVPARLGVPSPLCDDSGAVSEMLHTSRSRGGEISGAEDVVRLIDEHDRRIIVFESAPARPRGTPTDSKVPGPWSPRAWRALAATLILIGTLALIDAGVTLVWQEPISALYARLRQNHLNGALAKVERAAPTPREQRALLALPDQSTRIAFLARELRHRAGEGSPVARIRIPRIGA